ncbi:MAG: preprotein translocase subunit SecE [Nitrospirota bacterium]|jgi:preprotein translocase subunit SecE
MLEKTKQFMREVKMEMKKTVYPSKDELLGSTWVVIITVFIVSFYLGVIDVGLSRVVRVLLR